LLDLSILEHPDALPAARRAAETPDLEGAPPKEDRKSTPPPHAKRHAVCEAEKYSINPLPPERCPHRVGRDRRWRAPPSRDRRRRAPPFL